MNKAFLRIWLYETYTVTATEVKLGGLIDVTVEDVLQCSVNDQMTVTASTDYDVRVYSIDYANKVITLYAPFVSGTVTALAFNYTLIFWAIDFGTVSKLSPNEYSQNMINALVPNLQGVTLPTITRWTVPVELANFFDGTCDRTLAQVLLSITRLRGKKIQVELVDDGLRERFVDAVISEQMLTVQGLTEGELATSISFNALQEEGY